MSDHRDGHSGGCQCGAIRYLISGPILKVYVCHCTECRKQSASAFGISAIADRAAFSVTRGEPKRWSRTADSGRTVACYFCAACGSRLWHEDAEGKQPLRIKGGSLDEPIDLQEATHIWVSRKLPGVQIPAGADQHETAEKTS